ncbi:MAG: nuclear transport factor 2 family protein [Pseudomonadales bacterium]|nr:nuclear transport factor 2 family protein [Pseudomonadales bacterium]MCP5165837.1 nuclear transport factor 2 family protein [Pseudomonadales bacterium]
MSKNEHPARRAALLSREYVHSKNREGWLGLYAEDAIIEDPIGVSPIDPEGKGHRGPAAREAFWDNFIAPANINIDILDSYAAGLEVANHVVISVTVDLGDGKALQQKVHGVITYKVNEEGKLLALRAYWEIDDPRNQMVEVATGNGQ